MTVRRVVEVHSVFVGIEALYHQEVVEIPVRDIRARAFHGALEALLERLALEPVALGRLHDVGRLAAIARDTARLAQVGERHDAPEVLEHDAECSRPALHGLQLQQQRCLHSTSSFPLRHVDESSSRCRTTPLELWRYIEIGLRCSTVHQTSADVPAVSSTSGPVSEVH